MSTTTKLPQGLYGLGLKSLLTYFLCTSPIAQAAPELLKEPLLAPLPASPWQLEFGARYWYSSGKYIKNLYGYLPKLLVSRLSYEDLTANSAEAFWKLAHLNGVYLKGYLGGGSIHSGQLIDEDFPPDTVPYSRTISDQKRGALSYLSFDLGHDLFRSEDWRLGAFIGYHYWQEQVNDFGCTQIAGNSICVPTVATPVDVLDNSAHWNSLRLGANGELQLSPTLNLEADLAYIHSSLNEHDFHNLRPSIRGMLDTGTGDGFQLDALLKWQPTEDFTLGLGGRWWRLTTDGWAHFEQTADSGQPQALDGSQNRYGLLVQASYQFLDKPKQKDKDMALDYDWEGPYLGANLGYATNPSVVYFYPLSNNAQVSQVNGATPFSLNLQNAGFLAGGQIGHNWQFEQFILGLEGDLDYAQIGGANATTSIFSLTTTVDQNIDWFGSVRARLGKLASESMLVYLTAGPAWGDVSLGFDERNISGSCSLDPGCISGTKNHRQNGWTAGAGIEYAITPSMSFKGEYLYLDLGRIENNLATIVLEEPSVYQIRSRFNENIVRLGLNYKINAF